MESELFGHKKGSFTGAVADKLGLFQAAEGGTLFLDEVADLPFAMQVKLLRAIQEKSVRPVGVEREVAVDVRILSASHKDLDGLVKAGSFRQDLYYRLNVVPIEILPLRDRPDDIPDLIAHFMDRSASISGVTPRIISPEAMAALQAYEWPGNVRQLRNAVDWILIMAPGGPDESVGVDNLPPDIGSGASASVGFEGGARMMSLPLREARENFERQYLLAQVSRFGGNVSRTAEFVGMERSALYRKMKTLGVTNREIAERAGETVSDLAGQ